ncbi:hypothetical protein MMC20_001594 [Loxospora ochrophaea]|nr:hypothetical protein [Loxospora ochrophaea]
MLPLPLPKVFAKAIGREPPTSTDNQTQQSGRSSSGLAAEASSTAFRDNGSNRPPSAGAVPLQHAKEQAGDPTSDGKLEPTLSAKSSSSPQEQLSHRSSHPFPSNPDSSTTSTKSRNSYVECSEGVQTNLEGSTDVSRVQSSNALETATQQSRTIPSPPRRGRQHPNGPNELLRQYTSPLPKDRPTSLSELGRDYSRYPPHRRRPAPPPYRASTGRVIPFPADGTRRAVPAHQNPFSDPSSNADGRNDSEKNNSAYLDDRLGAAGYGLTFPLYLDDKELDDDMHTPHPDDDTRMKPSARDFFAREQLCSLFGMIFMLLGLLTLFIVLPVLGLAGVVTLGYPEDTPLDMFPKVSNGSDPKSWDFVNDQAYPLLENVRSSLIDPTTPQSAMTRSSYDGSELELVFSEEFNSPNRSFYPGDDPFWTAPNLWYGATQDLEWYDPDAVTTSNGTLALRLDKFSNHNLQYRSGMLNSWNQLCLKGGALEVSISLAGPGGVPGLWPGAWTMGNLGRPGYKASTEGIWPYTYNSCDAGITPNQSMTDGTSLLPGQKLPSCTCPGEDHPTPGTGRGAPEIDIIEASADPNLRIGVVTQSYQVAPYDIWYQPNYDFVEIPNYNTTQMNGYCGGPFQQAISGTTTLNNAWYDGNEYQKYAYEYMPGIGGGSGIAWYVGDDMSYRLTGDAVGPNGNIQSRVISEEPMSIVLNLGFSTAWTQIDYADLKFPTTMHVDYVRWYQKPNQTSVTCDPEGYETTEYIANHPNAYNNPNLTVRTCCCVEHENLFTDHWYRAGTRQGTPGPSIS